MHALPVRYIEREKIDVQQWDRCIAEAKNGLPYLLSYFLDQMSPGWSALVAGDYQLVMPLTWRRKWGISYLSQPAFVQQTGVISPFDISPEQLEIFLSAARLRFRFAEIFLNFSNHLEPGTSRVNFVLKLDQGYKLIRQAYKADLVNNLRAASKYHLVYSAGDAVKAIDMYRSEYTSRLPHVKDSAYSGFAKACVLAAAKGSLVVRSVSDESGVVLSSAVVLRDTKRLVLLLSVTGVDGRKEHANHFLLDQLVREYAGQPLLLDFEGSEVPGIAHFYKNFGAVDQPYFFYKFNDLPWFVRIFKT